MNNIHEENIEEIDFLDVKLFISRLIKTEEHNIKHFPIISPVLETMGISPMDLREFDNFTAQSKARIEVLTKLLMRVNERENTWKTQRDQTSRRIVDIRSRYQQQR
jgi:hypothetical protein